MKKIFLLAGCSALLLACSSKGETEEVKNETAPAEITAESIKEGIQVMDDSLEVIYKNIMENNGQLDRNAVLETINRHLSLYKNFPEDPSTATSLDKAQMLFMQLRLEEEAARWRATLLKEYPDYKDIHRIYQAQIVYYTIDNEQPEKAEELIRQALADSANMEMEQVEMLKSRLENIDLSFDELTEKMNAK
ncbi:hypothetical protein [Lishizhenia sp.]|uniref:hypothetical protein n=1 Tax=Lishizhenia sp. TaxID=2497594 RepID=UPI00299DB8E5|nr:hypothetical protein [Lishizhenia sp.]MDX1447050.1 hypothetical protein [Lishizhenia sp.]